MAIYIYREKDLKWKVVHISILVGVLTLIIASCLRALSGYSNDLNNAESVMALDKDSDLTLLDGIDPTELKVDSLGAKY